jgi:hypothetical protein
MKREEAMMRDILGKGTCTLGGAVLLGVGLGLYFMQQSGLAFLGALMSGLGAGLMLMAGGSGGSD